MTKTRKIYGPPGTGKTTTLVEAGVRIAETLGPDQLGMVTFTVAAADEIKLRIGQRLGMTPPAGRWERNRYFATRLPWIGTIHSISLRLLGGGLKVITPGSKEMNAFVRSLGGEPSSENGWTPDDPDAYGWGQGGSRTDDIEDALRVLSMSRHRMLSIPEVWNDVPWGREGPGITPERAEFIAQAYTDYKRQTGVIDFEDMAALGREHTLPVRALLVDEVQDNSPLLWSVTDRWSTQPEYTALAGDPYQAIYIFSGARPDLFINHPGDLKSLGNSRRLTRDAAAYAQRLLTRAGYQAGDGWLGSWTGTGQAVEEGKPTEFWLARTGALVSEAARWLEEDGVPYGYVRGGGPLQTKAAQAFRGLLQLRRQREIPVKLAAAIAEQADPGVFPSYLAARAKAQAREDPERLVSHAELSMAWMRDLDNPATWLKRGSYFEHIARREGLEPFVVGPRTLIGTVHAAKGREADVVHLVSSWGYLPAAALAERAGARAEACVAYVGVTRHRHRLVMEPLGQGHPYPW